ncbi:hypothetical protein [Puniceibacterium confluentis]|uniref:hypothetical protein n=1 Tax=Puniceibacterium confluentis TaxID=1958944 RepID=UPI0011B7C011|nr:hypothetical protein [Puniceibacterium confluentis]
MSTALSLALGHHPISRAVTSERASAQGLELDVRHIDPIHNAFAPMIREQRFDISELAIASAMQAVAYDKPLVLLPVTLAARYQHKCLVCNSERGAFSTDALVGKRVGVRAYTQTTGAWVRTILQTEYGIAPLDMHWVTQMGAHVEEYPEPAHVERVGKSASLVEMLQNGDIDAAIFGNDLPDLPWVVPVIADPEAAGRAAHARTGVVPINHVLTVSADVVARRPEVLTALMALFRAAKTATGDSREIDLYPLGLAAMRPSVEVFLASAYDQKLLPDRISFEELFAPARRILGELAD